MVDRPFVLQYPSHRPRNDTNEEAQWLLHQIQMDCTMLPSRRLVYSIFSDCLLRLIPLTQSSTTKWSIEGTRNTIMMIKPFVFVFDELAVWATGQVSVPDLLASWKGGT